MINIRWKVVQNIKNDPRFKNIPDRKKKSIFFFYFGGGIGNTY